MPGRNDCGVVFFECTPPQQKPSKPTFGEMQTIMADSLERNFLLYFPSDYNGTDSIPLIFDFHGSGSNPVGGDVLFELFQQGPERAVYLDGAGRSQDEQPHRHCALNVILIFKEERFYIVVSFVPKRNWWTIGRNSPK